MPPWSDGAGCGGQHGRTVIGNGLLPNAPVTSARGQQDGLDIGAARMPHEPVNRLSAMPLAG